MVTRQSENSNQKEPQKQEQFKNTPVSEERDDILRELIADEDDEDSQKENIGEVRSEEIPKNMIDNNNNKKKLMEERDKKLDEQNKKLAQERNREVLLRGPKAALSFILSLFHIHTYMGWIQRCEDFLMVLFLNALIVGVIFSLVFISYIIIKSDGELKILIFKLVGAICVAAICLVAQANIPNPFSKDKKKDEE